MPVGNGEGLQVLVRAQGWQHPRRLPLGLLHALCSAQAMRGSVAFNPRACWLRR